MMKALYLAICLLAASSAHAWDRHGGKFADYDHGNGNYGVGYRCNNGEVFLARYNGTTVTITSLKDGWSLGTFSTVAMRNEGTTVESLIAIVCKEK